MSSTHHPLSGHVDDLKAQAKEAVRKVGDHVSDKVAQLHDSTAIARHDAQVFIETNPWLAVALAASAGFLLGAITTRVILRAL